jgi:hypothetical protein
MASRQNYIFNGSQAGWLLNFEMPPSLARRFHVLDYARLADPVCGGGDDVRCFETGLDSHVK